jgi:hypothetical protein
MAVHFYVGQDVVACLAPQLLATPADIEILAERLASYAVAIIAGEVQRRL